MPFKTLLFPLLFLCLFACGKEEVRDTTSILTSQSWRITASTIDGISKLEDCSKDDRYTFNQYGTLTLEDLGKLCNNSAIGTWSLSDDGKILTLIDNSFPTPMKATIVELNEWVIRLEGELAFSDAIIPFTFTYEPF